MKLLQQFNKETCGQHDQWNCTIFSIDMQFYEILTINKQLRHYIVPRIDILKSLTIPLFHLTNLVRDSFTNY